MIPVEKSSNVTYSVNAVCKTLSVPLVSESYPLGTQLTAPVWRQAVHASDFVQFPHAQSPECSSQMWLFRDQSCLVIGLFLEEKEGKLMHLPADYTSIWQGDLVEFHFGGMEPDPWTLQLVFGIDGQRFDSSGSYSRWEARTFCRPDGWGAEIRIDLEMLRLTEGGIRFNLAREAVHRKEHSVWSPLQKQYHETPNFGEILFATYSQIASLRSGKCYPPDMSRQDFERCRCQWETPACKITCGPFLSNPDSNSVSLTWRTAGKVAAYITCRPKDSLEPPLKIKCGCQGGILRYESIHFVELKNLQPGVEYEYEIFSLMPITGDLYPSGIKRSFHLPQSSTFSFFCFTDLHSDVEFLRNALRLPQATQALFQASLGDNFSCAPGIDGICDGLLDPWVASQRTLPQDIPFVFVRGNHDELGVYAAEYFKMMRHPSDKTWYTFTQGDVFFIVLDSGDDKLDSPVRPFFDNTSMFEEEQRFLEAVVASNAYQNAAYRIVLMHIPPINNNAVQKELIAPLHHATLRPDIMLCGHEHQFIWQEAGNDDVSFPILVCSNKQLLSCSVTSQTLTFSILEPIPSGQEIKVQQIEVPRH